MLIGRERERAAVAAVAQAAREGRGAALLLRGEPGIGKTALLRESYADADDLTVLRVRGLEAESALAYAGLAALCGPVLHLRDRLPQAQRTALGRALAIEEGVPQGRLAVGAAVLGLLSLAAEERPVLAVLDDMQWLDEPSREAITFAARRLGPDGVGLLLGERVVATAPPAAPGVEALTLGPLGEEDARAMLAAGPPLAPAVAERVLATAGGNPLALVEIPALLSPEERDGRVATEQPLPPGSRLEGVLADRLRDLPDATRRALVVAAAAEVRRGDVVLAALAREDLSLEDLEPAEARQIVEFRGGEVRFRHPLLRAAAYHAGTPAERRRAHRHVAAVLPAGDPQVAWQLAAAAVGADERVASALEAAGLDARARAGLLPAAHAFARAAHFSPDRLQRARRLLEAARDLLPAGESAQARRHLAEAEAALSAATGPDALALAREHRILRAQVELRAGAAPAAREVLEQEAHAIRLHDPVRAAVLLLEACLGAMLVREVGAWLTDAIQAHAVARGRSEVLEALALMQRGAAAAAHDDVVDARASLEAAEALPFGDGVLLAPESAAIAGHAWTWIEEFGRAERLLEQLIAAGRRAGAAGALPYPLGTLALVRWRTGRWDEAIADVEEAVALADQTGQASALVLALGVRGLLLGGRGEVGAAEAAIARALDLGERGGYPVPRSFALLARAELLAARGEDAVAAYEAVRDEALPGNHVWAAPLVEALARAGAPASARAVLAGYEAVRRDRPLTPALLERCRGLLAAPEDVDEHFALALRLHARAPTPLEAARTRLAWGERLVADGRREDAREPLREAVAAFDRLGARLWADAARRELRAAGAVAARPAEATAAEELTPHELRVCHLAAQGMTNREAAAALFVSSKTIEHHLRNAFRKLGIRRRTELARVMAESGRIAAV